MTCSFGLPPVSDEPVILTVSAPTGRSNHSLTPGLRPLMTLVVPFVLAVRFLTSISM